MRGLAFIFNKWAFTLFLLFACSGYAATPPELSLDIGQENDNHSVYIEMTFTGAADGVSEINFSEWAGLTELDQALSQMSITAAQGPAPSYRKAEDGSGWLIEHQPQQVITVNYAIPANGYQATDNSRHYYRPMVSSELTHLIGHSSLLLPNHYHDTFWLDFQWSDTTGRRTFSSITGHDKVYRGSISKADLRGGLFIIGEIEIAEREIDGHPLYVSLQQQDWPFDLALLADLAERITYAERAYFADFEFPFFWVSAISTGQPMAAGYQFSGTLLANNFSLFLNPATQFEFDLPTGSPIVFLLAHEMMHVWIGSRLAAPPQTPPGQVAWFTEGFTNYFTQQVLLEAEIVSYQQYQQQVQETLAALQDNQQRTASNAEIAENFWLSMDFQMLPYQRGQLVAAYVDAKLTNTSLKQLLKEWLTDPNWQRGVNLELFLNAVRPHLSATAYTATEEFIMRGKLPADLTEVLRLNSNISD